MARVRVFGFLALFSLLACGETNSDDGENAGRGGAAGGAGATSGGSTTGGSTTGGSTTGGSTTGGSMDGGRAGANFGGAGAGGRACTPSCTEGRDCCGGRCVNLANDPRNCGDCGTECAAGTYCGGGQCVPPPCEATCGDGATCCGSSCCGAGELCCDPQGPIDTAPRCTLPSDQGTCPQGCAPLCICASPDTPIATPEGERAIASLRVGDLVYTIDRGELTIAPIVQTHRTPAQAHRVVRITLATGATLEISGAHPTADGRLWSDLRAGDTLDGVGIRDTRIIPYLHDATYDVLPDSDSGAYFAAGVLVGSTLARAPALVSEATAPSSAARHLQSSSELP